MGSLTQKLQQLTEEQHVLLHDICCLWVWLEPKLRSSFSGAICDKHCKMFSDGMLGLNSGGA